jgi:Fic family protein
VASRTSSPSNLPQRLKVLREHALIESAISSNRIEGVTVDQSRVKAVVLGKSLLRDRDEEEVRGYRDALKLIHEQHARLSISEKTIKQLHFISRAKIGDAGKYKTKDSDIIEKFRMGGRAFASRRLRQNRPHRSCANSLKCGAKLLMRSRSIHWSQ